MEPLSGEHGHESPVNAGMVFAMYQLIATFGVAIGAAILTFSSFALLRPLNPRALSFHNASWILTELPYFPVQILLGLWSGWWFGRRSGRRSMLRVWVLPLLILCYALIAVPTLTPEAASSVLASASPFSHYFGSSCSVRDHCIDQLLVTMPFYASISYSLGALIAREGRREEG
jgi:hypothetical protein